MADGAPHVVQMRAAHIHFVFPVKVCSFGGPLYSAGKHAPKLSCRVYRRSASRSRRGVTQ
eukprot:6814050-Pyramimonas_sp.AAC.2